MPSARSPEHVTWYTQIYINIPIQTCVCNIWIDVKLLTLNFCRGVRHDCGTALNEATTIMGYWVWSTQRTCHFNHRSAIFRQWQPAKPRTGMSNKLVSAFPIFPRHSCRNLWREVTTWFIWWMKWAFSIRTSWKNSFALGFSPTGLSTNSCQVLLECFLHVRCIPHQ